MKLHLTATPRPMTINTLLIHLLADALINKTLTVASTKEARPMPSYVPSNSKRGRQIAATTSNALGGSRNQKVPMGFKQRMKAMHRALEAGTWKCALCGGSTHASAACIDAAKQSEPCPFAEYHAYQKPFGLHRGKK